MLTIAPDFADFQLVFQRARDRSFDRNSISHQSFEPRELIGELISPDRQTGNGPSPFVIGGYTSRRIGGEISRCHVHTRKVRAIRILHDTAEAFPSLPTGPAPVKLMRASGTSRDRN